MSSPAIDPATYRDAIGRFATGVCIITAPSPDGPVGMTANAVASLSLDPLLLLVCFDRGARTLPLVREAGCFGVNVLTADQRELARRFASKTPELEKFAGVAHEIRAEVPRFHGALAWLGCELERLVEAGDHLIAIGAVRDATTAEGEPLLWYRGSFVD